VKWRLVIRPLAETDLREAKDWYESQHAGLGYTVYYRGFRRLFVRRFPYKLFYRLEGDRVIVSRILHARRDHPQFLRPENS